METYALHGSMHIVSARTLSIMTLSIREVNFSSIFITLAPDVNILKQ